MPISSTNTFIPGVGRPRSLASHTAILRAAYQLAAENGYHSTSLVAIAAKAGVGRQTIYRWWPTKQALYLEVIMVQLAQANAEIQALPDNHLETLLKNTYQAVNTPLGDICMEVMAEARGEADFMNGPFRQFIKARQAHIAHALRVLAAQRDAHFPVSEQVLIDMIAGAMWYRLLIRHGELDEQLAAELTQAIESMLQKNTLN